jgi:hypothetical protein
LAPISNVIFGGSRMNSLTLAALRLDIFRDRRCAPFAWPARAQGSARMTDFDFAIWFGIPCSVLVLAWVGVLRHERSAAKGATREVRRPNRSSQAIVPGVR